MTGRRVVLPLTCLLVAGLSVLFTVTRWEQADRLATVVSALAGVAAVGVALWAAWPARGSSPAKSGSLRVSNTGDAVATGGFANTGIIGSGGADAEVDRTGRADADGGQANTGIRLD